VLGFVAVVLNGIAGVIALVAWRVQRWRGRWLWILTIVAESLFMLDVIAGTVLVAAYKFKPPGIHMFYGFLVFLTVGLAFQYRDAMRGRTELLYGLVGLFLMGLGIRAVFNVTS
jgi:putative Ca2+/H+ antiporter (TMEM165/GDT1 family)